MPAKNGKTSTRAERLSFGTGHPYSEDGTTRAPAASVPEGAEFDKSISSAEFDNSIKVPEVADASDGEYLFGGEAPPPADSVDDENVFLETRRTRI
jgi:hypothetical protein